MRSKNFNKPPKNQKICSLPLRIEDLPHQTQIADLYAAIARKKLKYFKPFLYLGDEWFSPDGVNAISIPFYLTAPELQLLEKQMHGEVEGDKPEAFRKLLFHEAGHCFDHCYQISETLEWRTLFGPPDQDYHPDFYLPRPYSKKFVRHLPDHYAQAHPHEDFAETFAVWLTLDDWKKRYKNYPTILAKLSFIDHFARQVHRTKPRAPKTRLMGNAIYDRRTLGQYYKKRRIEFGPLTPGFYDPILKRLFTASANNTHNSVNKYLQENANSLITQAQASTGINGYFFAKSVKLMTQRSKQLNLRISKEKTDLDSEIIEWLCLQVRKIKREGYVQSNQESSTALRPGKS